VIDASDPEYASQLEVTEKLLCDLGASDKPLAFSEDYSFHCLLR
jgi:50S ribosomal subunit-associated GTPase HflX